MTEFLHLTHDEGTKIVRPEFCAPGSYIYLSILIRIEHDDVFDG